ncbi:2-dehydropantoate 2-reductase [Aurantimonas sp. 22II-16-19i]|uniref:2-dehydropantoate 2-reductase n=1 Tax=Aurantimonas sp. 22II-16-19i TaxID=1317114 RepID=UPI0009F7EFAD|nr:2-dehydropantoate 2-reductase [Aurantimonas sp. 22II-16-19i]ORE98787.1 2-dehydropantoate 2-reductase [Aurantimonas sp. 22II-16-19i]
MKVTIFGAGAIGGLIGARLAERTAAEVGLVARGPHLKAMQENGLTVRSAEGETTVSVRATDDAAALGPQDYVIIALKAHSVPGILPALKPLLGPDTAVVTAQNGLPWWYFYKSGGEHEGRRIEAVDPGGAIWDTIGPERAIGCVVHPAADIEAPGIVRHTEGERLPLGEPSGEKSERALALSKLLVEAGFRAPVRPQIRSEIWVKLWGNVSFNPISALTGATLAAICGNADARGVARAMMLEAEAIASALGIKFPIDVDKRIAGAAEVGEHKTSMLQDLELGRPMEVDALVTSVQEMGRLTGVATPTIDTVLGLIRLRAATPLGS